MTKITSFSILVSVAVGVFALGANTSVANGVWHSVHVGGPDACAGAFGDKPGCDKNFSLNALQFEDGTVTGQFNDRFVDGQGIHGDVDCLLVIDNVAHIGGTITSASQLLPENEDLVGFKFYTLIEDNGKNRNQDVPDRIAGTFFFPPDFFTCEEIPFIFPFVTDFLNDAPWGQVQVK